MKKNSKRLFGAMFVTLLMGLSSCNSAVKTIEPQPIDGVEPQASLPALNVRRLNTGTNSSNQNYITFEYTISPANASDRSVITTLTWTDPTVESSLNIHVADYLSVSANDEDLTITVTCLQEFSYQAKLHIVAAAKTDLYADVLIDYETRLLSFNMGASGCLYETGHYTLQGNSYAPWWDDTFDSLTNNSSDHNLLAHDNFYDKANSNILAPLFDYSTLLTTLPRTAVYSNGSVNNTNETLSATLTVSNLDVSCLVSITDYLCTKLESFFQSKIDAVIADPANEIYLTDDFETQAPAWADDHLSESETAQLHSRVIRLIFDLGVTFSASNGISETTTFHCTYDIDGKFWDIPVSAFTAETNNICF